MAVDTPSRISFASDNTAGAHPDVLQAVVDANDGCVMGYGADAYTAEAEELFRSELGDRAQPFLVFAGSAANVIALQAVTRSGDVIICSSDSHVFMSECGAPERLTGAKLIGLQDDHGRIAPRQIAEQVRSGHDPHSGNPAAVSITQATEKCTVYRPKEIRAIADTAHEHGLKLHMDGARLANAAVGLGVSLREITVDAGVDILSFGGTKNGLLGGEAVVCFDEETAHRLRYVRMQSLHLASKMRFLSVQFSALLRDGLWRRCAENANATATRLAAGLEGMPGVELLHPVEANLVVASLPAAAVAALHDSFDFYDRGHADGKTIIRLVGTFRSTTDEVDAFLEAARRELENGA